MSLLHLNFFRAAIPAVAVTLAGTAAFARPETGSRVDPAPSAVTDTANTPVVRRVVNQFARCTADTRAEWADQTLELPFTSQDQMRSLARVGGFDVCFSTVQFDLKLSYVSLLGGMAESRILKRFKTANVAQFKSVNDDQLFASAAAPRNTSEDFALCLARKEPEAVRSFIDIAPTNKQEAAVFQRLIPHLSACLPQGMTIKLNQATIRAYAVYGLYRLHMKFAAAAQVPAPN